MAAAINRGIEARAAPIDGRVEIRSELGKFQASLEGHRLARVQSDSLLKPFGPLFSNLFTRFRKAVGMKIEIRSSIPEQSGLASSAAVSAALIRLGLLFLEEKVPVETLVDWIYESEIEIQKRGSILGSSCSVLGGFVTVKNGKWGRLDIQGKNPEILVIDSRERCATSKTTAHVKRKLDRDRKATEALFDEMDDIAQAGKKQIEEGNWPGVGSLMNQNQVYLQRLGVSTPKIDSLIREIKDWVWGSKITGAGGGGCVVCIPKEKQGKKLAERVAHLNCRVLKSEISRVGVRSAGRRTLCKA